jgi:hypothetical protein
VIAARHDGQALFFWWRNETRGTTAPFPSIPPSRQAGGVCLEPVRHENHGGDVIFVPEPTHKGRRNVSLPCVIEYVCMPLESCNERPLGTGRSAYIYQTDKPGFSPGFLCKERPCNSPCTHVESSWICASYLGLCLVRSLLGWITANISREHEAACLAPQQISRGVAAVELKLCPVLACRRPIEPPFSPRHAMPCMQYDLYHH